MIVVSHAGAWQGFHPSLVSMGSYAAMEVVLAAATLRGAIPDSPATVGGV
jgi:hypothetical protein